MIIHPAIAFTITAILAGLGLTWLVSSVLPVLPVWLVVIPCLIAAVLLLLETCYERDGE